MIPEYDEFRAKPWPERAALFTAMSAHERAELFRMLISVWLERHRNELTSSQVALLRDAIDLCTPELYIEPRSAAFASKVRAIETTAAQLFTPEQLVDVLTIQWGRSCRHNRVLK